MTTWISAVTARVRATRVARTLLRYVQGSGPLLAQGLSYKSIFATFAALWVAFAVFGFWLRVESPLQTAIIDMISTAVPGLIDQGDGGAVRLDSLLSVQVLSWTGGIAALGLIWTTISWFTGARHAVTAMLGAPDHRPNVLLLKLIDAGFAAAFGIAIVVSAVLSVVSTTLLDEVLGWIGITATSALATFATRAGGLVVTYAFDFGLLLGLFLVMGPRARPTRAVVGGAALGAGAFGILKALGGLLLGGAGSNPLLAGFAVIGLLFWFNLLCQTLLITAAWIGEAKPLRPLQ